MPYPDNCLRGLIDRNWLTENGFVGSEAFQFSSDTRDDGCVDLSINWQDDDQAIDFTLQQRKPDQTLQFKAGVAILSRSEVDRINTRPEFLNILSYEREELPENSYHGNILLPATVDKKLKKMISGSLAAAVERTEPNTYWDNR